MGHFGKFPIRLAWFTVVLPSLVLNYFGQGALLLKTLKPSKPLLSASPRLGTDSITYSGDASHCYCLTGGDFWRIFTYSTGCSFRVFTTHANYSYFRDGIWPDIYPSDQLDPLFSGGVSDYRFERSSNLAAAYGIAVTGTMVITSILFCTVAWKTGIGIAFSSYFTDGLVDYRYPDVFCQCA